LRTLLETIVVAFSMFSAIPMPPVDWNERNMRFSLCAFPLVGAVIGLGEWGCAEICRRLAFPPVLAGAILTAIPVVLTGGIHLDGFADTSDALSAHTSPERGLDIMKDPHIGAFGVIRLIVLMLLNFGLWSAAPLQPGLWVTMFVFSRSLSGLAVASFPMAKNTGLAHTFATEAARGRARTILSVMTAVLALALAAQGWIGVTMLAAAVGVFFYYNSLARRRFGGITGDLAGWFLVVCETAMLAACVIVPMLLSAI